MNLGDFETDALGELFNVGLNRAAGSLSEITGQRIEVDMPKLVLVPVHEIEVHLADLVGGEVASIHQMFGGAVAGDAVLLMEHDKAAELAKLMTDGDAALGGRLDESAREVLVEIGNIVLGACLSGFGDMLHTPVSFSVPRIHIESLKSILRSMAVNDEAGVMYAVIVATQFRLSELAVDGYMIVAVGAQSLDRISGALAARVQ